MQGKSSTGGGGHYRIYHTPPGQHLSVAGNINFCFSPHLFEYQYQCLFFMYNTENNHKIKLSDFLKILTLSNNTDLRSIIPQQFRQMANKC